MQDIHYWTVLNCAPGEIPLNSKELKDQGIQRNQRIKVTTIREILLAWDNYRLNRNVRWIFKADLSGCYNQLHWSQASAVRIMGFVLTAGILMII